MIIVDTDILIDAGRNVSEAINCLEEIDRDYITAISSITQMELIVGCRNNNELRSLNQLDQHHQRSMTTNKVERKGPKVLEDR